MAASGAYVGYAACGEQRVLAAFAASSLPQAGLEDDDHALAAALVANGSAFSHRLAGGRGRPPGVGEERTDST